jgi:arylsulfatase A-like enzyme
MNVVVFIADALRKDALGGTGGTESDMPLLASRFADWHTFDRCFSAAPWTLPSVTSLLTGQSAAAHGHFLHDHHLDTPLLTDQLDPSYLKAAIVNNSVLDQRSGLFDGFDEYSLYRRHDETFDAIHRFLDARDVDQRPFFLLAHSNLTHDYNLWNTRPHYEWYYPDRDDWFEIGHRVLSWKGMTQSMRDVIPDMYRACAKALDDATDRLFARLDPSETAIVFTADHGEGFDADRSRVHHGGRLHDDLIRVPCAVSVPAESSTANAALAQQRDRAISSTDLLPTLLSLVGQSVPDGLDGVVLHDEDDGEDGRRITSSDRRYLYLASGTRLNVNERGKNMTRAARLRNQALRRTVANEFGISAVVEYPYKLVITEFVGRDAPIERAASRLLTSLHVGSPVTITRGRQWFGVELFDLEADPGEAVNLLADRPSVVEDALALATRPQSSTSGGRLRDLVRDDFRRR